MLIIMNSLNDNVTMRCSVRNSNLVFEIINKIYSEALASCSGKHLKGKTLIPLVSQLYNRINDDSVHIDVTRNFNAMWSLDQIGEVYFFMGISVFFSI